MKAIFLILLLTVVPLVSGTVTCPTLPSGEVLTCAFECCESLQGNGHGSYCCGMDDKKVVTTNADGTRPRSERFVAYSNGYQIDYSLLILGLVISIIVSILLSLLCCLLCNGCWLHRRRNPHEYEYNRHVENDSGFLPICCGFGIPTGTIVFSTHPPQFNNDDIYNGSSNSSNTRDNRVRWNDDGQPRSVLKHPQN